MIIEGNETELKRAFKLYILGIGKKPSYFHILERLSDVEYIDTENKYKRYVSKSGSEIMINSENTPMVILSEDIWGDLGTYNQCIFLIRTFIETYNILNIGDDFILLDWTFVE